MCTIVIHGGAGVISKGIAPEPYYAALSRIITQTFEFATNPLNEATAVSVVEFGVKLLEDEELFNAGRGAVFTADATHELEASIMDGSNLKCGAVSLVNTVRNPISLAKAVMDRSAHNYIISAESQDKLATESGLERVDMSYYSTQKRLDQLALAKERSSVFLDHSLPLPEAPAQQTADSLPVREDQPGGTGTVGCVCVLNGNVAAATSTGGLTNKMSGRVGDTPIIGAGNYANNRTGAFSGTGTGEDFMRHVAAHDCHCRVLYGGESLEAAVRHTVFDVLPDDCGGIIAVNASGQFAMPFNTPGMFRAVATTAGVCQVGIWEEMLDVERV